MNIEYYRDFIELAKCLNYTQAAKQLNITQPALSKHIVSLEREFGLPLFERGRKKLHLTEAGRILFESASIIVDKHDETKAALNHLKMLRPLRVVGHTEDPGISMLAPLMAMIGRDFHNLQISFESRVCSPVEALADETVDAFIGYVDQTRIKENGLRARVFLTGPLLAIVNKTHPLASREYVTWADLQNYVFLRLTDRKIDAAWNEIVSLCEHSGFTPKTRTVPARNDVEFFSCPLRDNVLVWTSIQPQLDLYLQTDQRAGIPIRDTNSCLVTYIVYRPENEARLEKFFEAHKQASCAFRWV